jgi:ADP-heptose:LPS heptosyltransferase
MSQEQERISNPLMEYYRHVYHFSPTWNGKDSLAGKTVIIYCEQGFGDTIQMMRWIPALKEHGCNVILHAPKELHPILECLNVDLLEKNNSNLPKHDYHILSLSLPFRLGVGVPQEPYIKYSRKADVSNCDADVKIGIAWEGSPEHPKNLDRCCPLKHFKTLINPGTALFMLQNKINLPELVEDVDFDVYSTEIKDFGDTAALINAMDFVVSIDTAVLHLAGAMGKRTYGILSKEPDPRWSIINWYESTTLISGEWDQSFAILMSCKQ